MRLTQVSFKNANAGNLEISYKLPGQFAAKQVVVSGMQTSAALDGTLLSMDLFINGTRYSVDFTNYLPNGLWVQEESPYRVVGVLDGNGQHVLHIQDNGGDPVVEFQLHQV
jgi:hypothetical protein